MKLTMIAAMEGDLAMAIFASLKWDSGIIKFDSTIYKFDHT